MVSPGLHAGGGLKRERVGRDGQRGDVSPGLHAGGGLKPVSLAALMPRSIPFPPVFTPGAD